MTLRTQRKEIMKTIVNTIREARDVQKSISKEKLIALLSVDYGVARRTAVEYIDNLILISVIKCENKDGEDILTPFP